MGDADFILASLRHYRRIHLAVALGVAVATAVLAGALLVGDSMRGSLRDLTLERLGAIDTAIVSPHMFREKLAGEMVIWPGQEMNGYTPWHSVAILTSGTLQSGSGKNARRATSLSVIGCEPRFWTFDEGRPEVPLAEGEVAITEPLARELDAKVGDSVLLRVPAVNALPADSPLGAKQADKTTRSRQLKVAAVLPAVGLARFSLAPSQQLPRNVFVPLATLQGLLEQQGKVNAILIGSKSEQGIDEEGLKVLRKAFHPKLEDLGIRVKSHLLPTPALVISSDELVLPDAVVYAAERAAAGATLQPVITYLANTIEAGPKGSERKIPYSTITGVHSLAGIGPVLDDTGKPIAIADNEIVLNRWAADDLGAKVGDDVTISFYDPESTHGRLTVRKPAPFKLRAIVDLKDANGHATPAADPKLTPTMPGVTDQKSISDWDLPFELVETIRPQDEKYWDEHRTTPKAFVSFATAKRLFASRWGAVSLIRSPVKLFAGGFDTGKFTKEIDPSDVGMQMLPVKRLGLQAAAGTTPFGLLFLGFSFFLIAAAVMLVALLFQLGIQQRVKELGTLAAVGIDRKEITRLLSREGVAVSAAGATFGVVAGVLYAWLVVYALTHWWVAAISTPFLKLHIGVPSLLIGWLVGVVASWLAIRWSIRKFVRLPAARLLAGSTDELVTSARGAEKSRGWRRFIAWPVVRATLLLVAIGASASGFFLHGEEQAGSFFASGAAVLALLLGEIRHRLRHNTRGTPTNGLSLLGLSMLNTARNPGRSTLTIGLVAAASFLIVAISAFRLETGDVGTGGFEYVATSDQPLHYDLNTADGRRELGISDAVNKQMSDWRAYSLRVAVGEDASCLNLYQARQPRVLGVPDSLIERGGFGWSATSRGFAEKPWTALNAELGNDASGRAIVPAVLDMSTVVYSLHLSGVGSRLEIHDATGRPVTVQVVGLLENSVLQGNLLVSERNFLKLFPDTGGYRFFLLEYVGSPSRGGPRSEVTAAEVPLGSRDLQGDGTRSVPAILESALAEEGFDVVVAREQLAQFLAVQNTYLSTFQSLGALGLLLGTIGLAVVQLRSVLERRGELALMRAGGFGRGRLTWMVIWENAVLLLGGLLVGGIAAAVALVPQWLPHSASVPWATLAGLLGVIAVVGMLAGWLATRSTLRAPIVAALRGD